MSEENEQVIRRGFEALNRRDLEAAKALADPECEIRTRTTALAGRTYRGHGAVEQWFADMAESWEDVRQSPERMIEVDDERTIVELTFEARGKASGVEIVQTLVAIWTVRNGKVTRAENYSTLDEALEAAGLSE
jgi:ketosteroid isomerase-like protein